MDGWINGWKYHDFLRWTDIKTPTTSILRVYGFTWDNIPIKTTGPNHMGLTRILSWQKKGSKHIYQLLRANVNRGALTSPSEHSINLMLGQMQSPTFFNNLYRNVSKIKCNPRQKFQELMLLLHRLNKHLSKCKLLQGVKMDPACTFCRLRGQIHYHVKTLCTSTHNASSFRDSGQK